mgnify:CR=1 FL=1
MNEPQPVISDETSPDVLNCIEVFENSINDPSFSEFLKNTEAEKRKNFFYLLSTNSLDNLHDIDRGGLSREEKKALENYRDSVSMFTESFKEVYHPEINWEDDGKWLNFYLNEFDSSDFNYRLYLNSKLEETPKIFEQLVVKLKNAGLNCSIKIPSTSNLLDKQDMTRSDKITIYFNYFDTKNTKNLWSIVEDMNIKNRESFNSETPLFANRLSKLIGVAVAQDPGIKGESFNSIRAKIFNDMYSEWGESGYAKGFNYEDSFQRCCKKYNVDPQEPWHNIKRS